MMISQFRTKFHVCECDKFITSFEINRKGQVKTSVNGQGVTLVTKCMKKQGYKDNVLIQD